MSTDSADPQSFDPVERQIREAIERGEFDSLPGAGKPLPDLDRPYEPSWWAKRWVARARIEDEAMELRQRIRRELPRLRAIADREAADRGVRELNEAILEANRHLDESERIRLVSLDDG